MLKLFKITGNSLFPFYKDAERVLCFKIFSFSSIKINDVVIFKHKTYGLMIKKVTKIENKRYFVKGTDPFSIDSRDFGFIGIDELEYKVLFKF